MDKNKRTGVTILMLALGMLVFAYAAFPLYSIFCKVTGYGGTPKINSEAATEFGETSIKVRFNSDVAADVPWNFKPLQKCFISFFLCYFHKNFSIIKERKPVEICHILF